MSVYRLPSVVGAWAILYLCTPGWVLNFSGDRFMGQKSSIGTTADMSAPGRQFESPAAPIHIDKPRGGTIGCCHDVVMQPTCVTNISRREYAVSSPMPRELAPDIA